MTNDEAGLGAGDDTKAIDVDTDAEVLRVLGCFVEVVTTPVMIPRVDEGALSGNEEPEADAEEELDNVPGADAEEELDNVPGADVEKELDNVPEADAEEVMGPRWTEMIEKVGLAFPESPITGEVY